MLILQPNQKKYWNVDVATNKYYYNHRCERLAYYYKNRDKSIEYMKQYSPQNDKNNKSLVTWSTWRLWTNSLLGERITVCWGNGNPIIT